MTLQQLKYVITISKTLNITQAAEQLFVSQPNLTKALNELEKEMNIKIFNRTNKGVTVTRDGDTFLAYARQVIEQAEYMEEVYKGDLIQNPVFSVSCQHYSFAVEAMIDTINSFDANKYNFTLRETQTHEIIEDVTSLRSELGIIYLSSQNEDIILNILKKNNLEFTEVLTCKPHVFLSHTHPLSDKKSLTIKELENYPYLCFEQGEYNSVYFSEEILSSVTKSKTIKVRDRATMTNMIVGLNGYTVCSGINNVSFNGSNMIAIPLNENEYMKIGYIKPLRMPLGLYATTYINNLKRRAQN
ncbi:MAG: LysR family transcriptional regulator [Clostridia bacterium]|nr:LysR family transcriptional regulator [Clostridia bacterium]